MQNADSFSGQISHKLSPFCHRGGDRNLGKDEISNLIHLVRRETKDCTGGGVLERPWPSISRDLSACESARPEASSRIL